MPDGTRVLIQNDRIIVTVSGQLKTCECCASNCVLYHRADACPLPPEYDEADFCYQPTGPGTIYIKVGTLVDGTTPVEGGDVVIVNRRCYLVDGTPLYRKAESSGETCEPGTPVIPDGSLVIEGPDIDGATGCTSEECIGGWFNFAHSDPCGGGSPIAFCRDRFTECVVGYVNYFDAGTPDSGCHSFSPSAERLNTVPSNPLLPEDAVVVNNEGQDCCQCGASISGTADCERTEVNGEGCCCGTPADNEASTWTITEWYYEITDSNGNRTRLEMVGTVSASIGSAGTVTIRSRTWFNDVPQSDTTYTSPVESPRCGPRSSGSTDVIAVPGCVPGDGATCTDTSTCNTRVQTFSFDDGAGNTVEAAYSWSRTPASPSSPCTGGCDSGEESGGGDPPFLLFSDYL